MKRSKIVVATAMTLALIACSNQASSDSPANNQSPSAAASSADSMMNDPSNPYAAAEMQMHERMMAAVGANASETWAKKMAEHHRGGIAMSDVLLAQGGDQRFLEKARKSADMQRKDITELERMLSAGITGSGPANPYAQIESRMHDQMMAAKGGNAAETWARKMIVHHQGAIDMSEALIGQGGGDPKVVAMARRTADMQRKEIRELQGLLGEGGPAAAQTPKAAPAAKTTRAPAPATSSPAPKQEGAADPHAGHDMSNMSHE